MIIFIAALGPREMERVKQSTDPKAQDLVKRAVEEPCFICQSSVFLAPSSMEIREREKLNGNMVVPVCNPCALKKVALSKFEGKRITMEKGCAYLEKLKNPGS